MILIYICLHPMLELCKEKLKMKFKILTTGLGQTNCQLITTKPDTLYKTDLKVILPYLIISLLIVNKFVKKNDIKYLGIILDNKRNWKPHIAKLPIHISKSCGILSKLRHYTTQPVLKAVYNALIHPYLNYAVLNWDRASKTTIQPLENLKNKAVKFLKTSNKATLDEIYIQNDILTINNLFKMSAGKFMHSYENNQLPSYFNQYFKSILTVHKYATRLACSNNFFLPRVKVSQGQCSLKFIGPKVWSEIPDHIKFRSYFDLKHLFKNFLLSGLVGANQQKEFV